MTTIEELWAGLSLASAAAQRRVDADHPCDLYADIDVEGRVGLIAICTSRPVQPPVLSAIAVEISERPVHLKILTSAVSLAAHLRSVLRGYHSDF